MKNEVVTVDPGEERDGEHEEQAQGQEVSVSGFEQWLRADEHEVSHNQAEQEWLWEGSSEYERGQQAPQLQLFEKQLEVEDQVIRTDKLVGHSKRKEEGCSHEVPGERWDFFVVAE